MALKLGCCPFNLLKPAFIVIRLLLDFVKMSIWPGENDWEGGKKAGEVTERGRVGTHCMPQV